MKKSPYLLIIIAIAILAAISVYLYRDAITRELNALKLLPQPETFTELYFANTTAIPTEITLNKDTSFGFVIHNLEDATTTYPYEAYLLYPSGQNVIFNQGTITLANNKFATITSEFIATSSAQSVEVVARLTSLNQQIDFYSKFKSVDTSS